MKNARKLLALLLVGLMTVTLSISFAQNDSGGNYWEKEGNTTETSKEWGVTDRDRIVSEDEEKRLRTQKADEAFDKLSEETKEELLKIKKEHEQAVAEFKEKLRDADLTAEDRDDLEEKLRELNTGYEENMKEVLDEDSNWEAFWKAREELRKRNNEFKEDEKKTREEIKKEREEFLEKHKEYKEEIKENREEFINEAGEIDEAFSELSEETKDELLKLRDEHKEDVNNIKEKMKDKNLTLEEKDKLKEELQKLNEEYVEKVKNLVSESDKALEYIEAREDLMLKNKNLREKAKEAREEFREHMYEMVDKYRKLYFPQLVNILPKLSTEKLETVVERLENMIIKTEENEKMLEEKKEKFLSQLVAIKELVEEELETRGEIEEELDLDEIFAD